MAKKKNKPTYECIVFIVEGDADELIIQKLIAYYKQQGWQPTQSIDIKKCTWVSYGEENKTEVNGNFPSP